MKFEKIRVWVAIIVVIFSVPAVAEEKQSDPANSNEKFATTPVEKLDDERYRIGEIILDRSTSSFSVPGKISHLTDALEYLAVSQAGMKEYESLLELTTTPGDFNLACILVGLDDTKSVKPQYQFDKRDAEGQLVSISLSWESDGETVTASAANALSVGEDVFDDDNWVYIGSTTGNYGKEFMANAGGTLIGFVHDPYSVIDHAKGAGIGNYGLVTGNLELLPPIGTDISLTIRVVQE